MTARRAKRASSCGRGGRGRSGSDTPGSTPTPIGRVEGDAGARRRRVADRPRRALHRPRLLQPALADPGAPLHARATRPVDAGFPAQAHRRRRERARARLGPAVGGHERLPAGQQRGRRPARAGGRRLRRRGGRSDHDAGDRRCGAPRSSTRSRPSSACKTIFELAPAAYAELEGFAAGLARRARRLARRRRRRRERHRAGGRAALRAEDRHVHRPARDAGARRRAGARRARARLLRLRGRLRAGRGARRRRGRHRRRQLGARRRAHRGARRRQRRQHRGRRGRRVPLPRDRDAAVVRSGGDRSAEVRARPQGSGGRAQGLRAAERAGAAGGRAGRRSW